MNFKSIFGAACLLSVLPMTPAFASGAEHAVAASHAFLLQRPGEAKFIAVPGVPECTTLAPLHGDMSKGPATLMV